jgi:hypothetical protein
VKPKVTCMYCFDPIGPKKEAKGFEPEQREALAESGRWRERFAQWLFDTPLCRQNEFGFLMHIAPNLIY